MFIDRRRPVRYTAILLVLLTGLGAAPARAADYFLLSTGVQARVGEHNVLGMAAPESFAAYDARASWRTPFELPFASNWVVGARGLTSAGLFQGANKTAVVLSAIPVLAIGTMDRRFTTDVGIGLGLLSVHRYAQQDFGGPLQVAITLGLEAPLYRQVGLSYRFMHYSDAGTYGPHTIGADLHMAGLSYRF